MIRFRHCLKESLTWIVTSKAEYVCWKKAILLQLSTIHQPPNSVIYEFLLMLFRVIGKPYLWHDSNQKSRAGRTDEVFPDKRGYKSRYWFKYDWRSGIYNLSGEYTNAPFSQSWGNLIVLSDGSKTQIVTEYTGSTFSIFIRGDNSRKWYKVNLTKDIWLLLFVQTNLQNGSTGRTDRDKWFVV